MWTIMHNHFACTSLGDIFIIDSSFNQYGSTPDVMAQF